jgi:hypothetical protein
VLPILAMQYKISSETDNGNSYFNRHCALPKNWESIFTFTLLFCIFSKNSQTKAEKELLAGCWFMLMVLL